MITEEEQITDPKKNKFEESVLLILQKSRKHIEKLNIQVGREKTTIINFIEVINKLRKIKNITFKRLESRVSGVAPASIL